MKEEILTAKTAKQKSQEKLTELAENFGNTENCSKLMEQIQLEVDKGKFNYRVCVPYEYHHLLDSAIAYLESNGFIATEEIEKVNLGQGCRACDRKYLNVKW